MEYNTSIGTPVPGKRCKLDSLPRRIDNALSFVLMLSLSCFISTLSCQRLEAEVLGDQVIIKDISIEEYAFILYPNPLKLGPLLLHFKIYECDDNVIRELR